jgi:4-amino-4-deoxy-L-arabinose transferase-like glycosyltransferase
VREHADPVETLNTDKPITSRRVDLTAISLTSITWIVVATLAIGIRLIGRTEWPLSPGETSIAHDAWALLKGNDLTSAADAHPALVQLTSLTMFLFGDTDYTARLVSLAAGVGILITLFWLRSWFGERAALAIAIIWAISPVMTMSTLRLDGGAVLVFVSLIVLSITMILPGNPSSVKAIVLGASLAIGLTVHPLGWIVIPLTLAPAMYLIRDIRFGGLFPVVLGTFAASFITITTWFFTRPTAIVDFFSESFSSLRDDHLSNLGIEWTLPFIVLLVDEPILLPLLLAGLIIVFVQPDWDLTAHPAIFLSIVVWAVPLLAVGVIFGGSGPALYSVTIFPLIVGAGLALSMLVDGLIHQGWNSGHPALWSVVWVGLLIAIFRLAEDLARGPEDQMVNWLVSAGALTLLILVPLSWAAIRLAAGTGWSLIPVTVMTFVAIFGAIELRTSLLLHNTSDDRPGEIMLAGSSTPAVGQLANRLVTYSNDVTRYEQDVRDPEGGRGLVIVVQQELANPFAWYLRDFPNLTISREVDDIPEELTPDVLIVPFVQQELWDTTLINYPARTYPVRYQEPDQIPDSTSRGLLLSAINPLDYANLFNFLVYRSSPGFLATEDAVVLIHEDHARVLWGE